MPAVIASTLRSRIAQSFRRPRRLDTIVFLLGVAAVVVEFSTLPTAHGTVGAYAGAALAAAGVIASRVWRWPALILMVGATCIDAVFWQPLLPWTVAVFVVFLVVRKGTTAVGAAAFVGSASFLAQVYADGIGFLDNTAFIAVACTVAAASIGSALRNRELARLSDELRIRDAIAAGENEVDRRIIEERLRIARDLHDVVGHEIAVVSMNLGVAQVNLPVDAVQARAALESARTGVQGVLQETQRILGVLRLREEDDSGAGSLRPAPGMAALPALIDSYRAVGLTVSADVGFEQAGIDPTIDVAIYRVVQEALTNAQRHGVGSADVSITNLDGVLSLRVFNQTRPDSPERSTRRGYGLVGMRERIASVGGTLQINDEGSSFSVVATLQLDGSATR